MNIFNKKEFTSDFKEGKDKIDFHKLLEDYDNNIKTACSNDDVIRMCENILMKARKKREIFLEHSPLNEFKNGNLEKACLLIELSNPADRAIWYLCFLCFCKYKKNYKYVDLIIRRIEKIEGLVFAHNWQWDIAIILLKYVIEFNVAAFSNIFLNSFKGFTYVEVKEIFLETNYYDYTIKMLNALFESIDSNSQIWDKVLDNELTNNCFEDEIYKIQEKEYTKIIYELVDVTINRVLEDGNINEAENLISLIKSNRGKVSGLLCIARFYDDFGDIDNKERILKNASDYTYRIKNDSIRKKYLYCITECFSGENDSENIIRLNEEILREPEDDLENSIKDFTKVTGEFRSEYQSNPYEDTLKRMLQSNNVAEAESFLNSFPTGYYINDMLIIVEKAYLELKDIDAVINLSEKYESGGIKYHSLMECIKNENNRRNIVLIISLTEKILLHNYTSETSYNVDYTLLNIFENQIANDKFDEENFILERTLSIIDSYNNDHVARQSVMKKAINILAAMGEYDYAITRVNFLEDDRTKQWAYIDISKQMARRNENQKALNIVNNIEDKNLSIICIAGIALEQIDIGDELNGIRNLQKCYKFMKNDEELSHNNYLLKLLSSAEAKRGNLHKAIENIKSMEFYKDEAIQHVLPYVTEYDILKELLKLAYSINIKLECNSFVAALLNIAAAFKREGYTSEADKITQRVEALVNLNDATFDNGSVYAYLAHAKLSSADYEEFYKLAKKIDTSYTENNYYIISIFKEFQDKYVLKKSIQFMDYNVQTSYNICEVLAFLYPEKAMDIIKIIEDN